VELYLYSPYVFKAFTGAALSFYEKRIATIQLISINVVMAMDAAVPRITGMKLRIKFRNV
jgi:hypothetical protein